VATYNHSSIPFPDQAEHRRILSLSIVIPSEQSESKALFSAFAEASKAEIGLRQIATRRKTKMAVTCSKQKMAALPNRYDFCLLINDDFHASPLAPDDNFATFSAPSCNCYGGLLHLKVQDENLVFRGRQREVGWGATSPETETGINATGITGR
jgi:hypothetical protein